MQGLKRTPLGGFNLTIGRNGIVDCENECPEHLTIPEIVGNTYVDYSYYFTFVCIVWFNFRFRKRVFYGLDFIYLYSKSSKVFLLILSFCLIAKYCKFWKKNEFDFNGLNVTLNFTGVLGFKVALYGYIWNKVINSPFKFYLFWLTQ